MGSTKSKQCATFKLKLTTAKALLSLSMVTGFGCVAKRERNSVPQSKIGDAIMSLKNFKQESEREVQIPICFQDTECKETVWKPKKPFEKGHKFEKLESRRVFSCPKGKETVDMFNGPNDLEFVLKGDNYYKEEKKDHLKLVGKEIGGNCIEDNFKVTGGGTRGFRVCDKWTNCKTRYFERIGTPPDHADINFGPVIRSKSEIQCEDGQFRIEDWGWKRRFDSVRTQDGARHSDYDAAKSHIEKILSKNCN